MMLKERAIYMIRVKVSRYELIVQFLLQCTHN